jgi:hypothetical protein
LAWTTRLNGSLVGSLMVANGTACVGVAVAVGMSAPELDAPSATDVGVAGSFDAIPSGGCAPYLYLWNFGDNLSAGGQSVRHSSSAAGTFLVTVTVTDAAGSSVRAGANVTVHASPASTLVPVFVVVGVILIAAIAFSYGWLRRRRGNRPDEPATPESTGDSAV